MKAPFLPLLLALLLALWPPSRGLAALQTPTVSQIVLHDQARHKDLPVRIDAPGGPGPFPVIVFSHGAGASGRIYAPRLQFWAAHGYVCLSPTHADSLALRPGRGGLGGLLAAVGQMERDPQGWQDRPRDVSFVLDSLPEIERRLPALRGRLDAKHIGVGGHSYGAYTTMLVGGATIDIPGGPRAQSFADPRARALLVLSGGGAGHQGLSGTSWKGVTRPMMVMTGSRDRGTGGQGPEAKRAAFDLSPPGDKFPVFLDGASHFSFSGRLASRPGEQALFDDVKNASLAFWDAYLKSEGRAKATLHSDTLTKNSGGTLRLSRR